MDKLKHTIALIIIQIAIIAICTNSHAQIINNVYTISNYKHDACLSICKKHHSKLVLTAYGQPNLNSSSSLPCNSYTFQGQEYEKYLHAYLFPSRMYSPTQKRFFQTDSSNQYASPYSFVGADPVNIIDFDGNTGKPLILYQQDFKDEQKMAVGMWEMTEELPNAHYVPLSQFINGEVGDLPEWNGNVFIHAHMGLEKGREIHVEEGKDGRLFKTRSRFAKLNLIDEDGTKAVSFDAEELGRLLKRFSLERGIPIHNIVAGGCQGEVAANAISRGIQANPLEKAKNRVTISGLKEGNEMFYAGPVGASIDNIQGLSNARMYIKPYDANIKLETSESPEGINKFINYHGTTDIGKTINFEYIQNEDLHKFIKEGRIPKTIKPQYTTFDTFY